MNGEIKVLQVDDDEIDIRLAKRALAKSSGAAKFNVDAVGCLSEAIGHLKTSQYDVILLDLGLPDSSGIETVQKVCQASPNIPIVVLTGLEDEETGLKAIKSGAADYLVKGPMMETSLVKTALYAIERKKVAEKLQVAEERYRTIFENSAVAITMADEQERLISWNKFTEDLLGFTKEDLHLKPVMSLYPEAEWAKIRTHDIRQKGMPHHLETKMLKKDGDVIDVDISISVLKDSEGRVTSSVAVTKDITERKEAERKIKEAMDLKSQFISTVSHELRTPLTIIKEDIALIMDGAAGRVKSKQREILEMAQRNIDRLARLINDVLDFQKLQSGRAKFNMQNNSINNVIETVYKTMANVVNKNGVELRLLLDNTLPRTTFDNDKITQVLTNLISNAMKFTEKGSITIATRRIENAIRVSVSDTGCGIKQEDLPKLFQQFQQLSSGGNRKTGGTGLGLVISKDIVEKHGGRVWVESEFGKGTTFHFLLPISSADSVLSAERCALNVEH
jgi:PAS domain S-box-containing protein